LGCLKLHIETVPNLRLAYSKKEVKPLKKTGGFYPFGLEHKGYNNNMSAFRNSVASRFKFGGKESGEELGLDWIGTMSLQEIMILLWDVG